MDIITVVIGMNNENHMIKLKMFLNENGYNVIDYGKDGYDCLRKIRIARPNIAILDYELLSYNGYEVAKILSDDKICSSILITNQQQKMVIEQYKDQWDFICITKPLNKAVLLSSIELMVKTDKKIKVLEKEINELKNSIQIRKKVEKAKGLLMKNQELTEEQAFRKIQKESMDKRISMQEIARDIILQYKN